MTTLFDKAKIRRTASISECGRYRWWLRREWDGGSGATVCFVMLNPSTADAEVDDPTIRRCIRFAQDWGYSRLEVRNLYPFRATKPSDLFRAVNRRGEAPQRWQHLEGSLFADMIVAAWGASAEPLVEREAIRLLDGTKLHCLGLTKHGHPRHPLYVRADTLPERFA